MQKEVIERQIDISGVDQAIFLGPGDRNIKKIEAAFSATITVRGNKVLVRGDQQEADEIERLITELIFIYNRNKQILPEDVQTVISVVRKPAQAGAAEPSARNGDEQDWSAILYTKDRSIKPKTAAQAKYCSAVQDNDLVFAIGPAGTGKTYLAVALAVAHLRDKRVSRIILTRPAVEAGESLGFLPGDLLEKVDPYLRPLYDALADMIPAEKLQRYLANKTIEVVPLAYMRGRTLNDAFLILDEAQNTSIGQMKMLLTRIGINAKAIVTGDVTQIDLVDGTESGLVQVQEVLQNVPGVAFVYLNDQDVVRHRLVRDIIKAYDSYTQKNS
ncbi:MAG TPA: PhoH family protein [Bacteroidetes bacterium]|nr:PhoH family protein [Bacteroidota bacterium]